MSLAATPRARVFSLLPSRIVRSSPALSFVTSEPWAPIASLPFAPEIALHAARNMQSRYPEILSEWRYASGFNPGLATADVRGWVSRGHFGLDQGIVIMMIENYRTGMIWRLMRRCPCIRAGLRKAGFRGGWL